MSSVTLVKILQASAQILISSKIDAQSGRFTPAQRARNILVGTNHVISETNYHKQSKIQPQNDFTCYLFANIIKKR
jgi:hypothetical protein